MIVYKFAANEDGKFLSFLCKFMSEKLVTEYEIGKKVYPPVGYLFAFKTLRDARAMARSQSRIRHFAILKCNASVTFKNQIASYHYTTRFCDIKTFWSNEDSYMEDDSFYDGTILCRWIEPIKVVEKQ